MAATATVTVTARSQTTQFFDIDRNMRPYFSCITHSGLGVWTGPRFDLGQFSGSPVARGSTRDQPSLFVCSRRRVQDMTAGLLAQFSIDNIRFHMPVPVTFPRRLPPEVDLLVLSFLGHFTWEILQAPLFASLSKTDHFIGIAICLKATLGDLVIALAAFWCAAFAGKNRYWFATSGIAAPAVFFAVGLLATVGLEYLSTEVLGRWAYDGVMPVLPVLGTGLSPILQWIFVPLFVLWYMRRLTPGILDARYNQG